MPSVGQAAGAQPRDRGGRRVAAHGRTRGLGPAPAPLPEPGHAGERPHRGLRERIARDPRLLERAHARRDARAADEGAGDRDGPAPRRADHRPRHAEGVGRRLGGEHHERGIRGVAADGVERMAVARGIGVAHEIDGVDEARRRRQHGGQPLAHRRLERLDLESRLARGVGRHDAEPAAVGHDEEPATARQGLARQPAREVEELLDGAHAKRPRLLDRRVERAIGARQRAGMRGDGARALGGAPRLQQHHRLHRRRRAQRLEEAPPVGHALDVADDDARLGVRAPPPRARRPR